MLSAIAVAVMAAQAVGTDAALAYPAGLLDSTFNAPTGKTTLTFGGGDVAENVLIQSDGKIVATGTRYSGFNDVFALARFDAGGAPDTGFGLAGTATTSLTGSARSRGSILDASGRIVVVGTAGTDFAVARFGTNGQLDTTFGAPNGWVVTDFGGPADDARDVVIQPDGKIVVVGTGRGNGQLFDVALARYLPNGTLDTTFGNNGRVVTNPLGTSEGAYAVALQPNGAIVVAGNMGAHAGLLRYKTDGTLDPSFGAGGTGFVTTNFGLGQDAFRAVALHPSGKILAGGWSGTFSSGEFAMARYLANGTLDNSFGMSGKVLTDMGGPGDTIYSLVLQTPDVIVAVGATHPFYGDFAVARYQYPSGQLDPAFGPLTTPGRVTTDFGGSDGAFGGAVDRKRCAVVAAGGSALGSGGSHSGDFALARYRLC